MTMQASLFAKPQDPPKEGSTRYEIEVAGVPIYADLNAKWMRDIAHIEFQSREDGVPNPLSETGYYSHFVMGSIEGMSDAEVKAEIQKIADGILKA